MIDNYAKATQGGTVLAVFPFDTEASGDLDRAVRKAKAVASRMEGARVSLLRLPAGARARRVHHDVGCVLPCPEDQHLWKREPIPEGKDEAVFPNLGWVCRRCYAHVTGRLGRAMGFAA